MEKYKLVKKPVKETNKFKVTLIADSNDADYITTIETYSKEIFDGWVIDELIDLKKNYSGRHELEDYSGGLDVPCSEYGRCHTISSITVEYIDENGVAWNVKF